jgi:hypothetical protein
LVGAVGIENTTGRNLKDLEGMRGNAKALKRNNRECKGILIGPSMAPRFFSRYRDSVAVLFLTALTGRRQLRSNFSARVAS